jgi:hypothetical protein
MLFLCHAMVPPMPLGRPPTFIAYVPMDDYHTLEWNVFGRPSSTNRPVPGNVDRESRPASTIRRSASRSPAT